MQNVRILEVNYSEAQGNYEGAKVDDQVIPTIFPDLEEPPAPDLDTIEGVETLRERHAAKHAVDLDAERILVSRNVRSDFLSMDSYSTSYQS